MHKKILTLGTLSIILVLTGASCSKIVEKIPLSELSSTDSQTTEDGPNNNTGKNINQLAKSELPDGFLNYTNAENTISINYPKDWSQQEGKKPIIAQFFTPQQSDSDKYQENVSIIMQDFSSVGMTLDQFEKQTTDALTQYMTDFKITTQEDTKINNNPGRILIFSGKMPGQDDLSLTLQAFTVSNNSVYAVTYTGKQDDFEKFVPLVQQMIKTFKF